MCLRVPPGPRFPGCLGTSGEPNAARTFKLPRLLPLAGSSHHLATRTTLSSELAYIRGDVGTRRHDGEATPSGDGLGGHVRYPRPSHHADEPRRRSIYRVARGAAARSSVRLSA